MRGNLTKKYHTYYGSNWYTYAWDAQDRLTKVVNNASNKTVEYKYDLYGRRAARRVDSGAGFGAWRWYFYDGLKVVAEGTGTADRIYYTNAPGDVGGIICRDQNGTTTHTYHYDRLGNVLAVSNGAGELAAVYESTAFDYALWAFGSPGFNQIIANPQPYHLTTKELDPDTGLYYSNARWYDKHVQRCVSYDRMLAHVLSEVLPRVGSLRCTNCSEAEMPSLHFNDIVTEVAQQWVGRDFHTQYIYGKSNPARNVDPDGRVTKEECEDMYDQCCDTCRGMPGNSFMQRRRRQLCFIACMGEYSACLAIATITAHPVETIMGVVIICGSVYLIVQTGGAYSLVYVGAAA